MTKKIIAAALFACTAFTTANAGGMLTNTNQNVAFLRNPARNAAVGIDGVYSNPAGVAFMKDGFHLSINWQAAWQTRTIESTNPSFAFGVYNRDEQGNPLTTKKYKGTATAPVIPSVQAAYNFKNWSVQFGFAVVGGGGKCTFDNGLGSFESAIGNITGLLKMSDPSIDGYSMNSYLQGSNYYYGITLGTAYKVSKNWSIYGGLRATYGSASYKAKVENIMVHSQQFAALGGAIPFANYIDALQAKINTTQTGLNNSQAALNDGIALLQAKAAANQIPASVYAQQMAQFNAMQDQINAGQAQLNASQASVTQLQTYRDGVNLQADQSGFSIAPIIGIHYHGSKLNLAAKYEFRTAMRLKNTSNVKEAIAIEAVNKFQDGTKIEEDIPAMLSLGAEYLVHKNVRISAGYHHFFDTEAQKYNYAQYKLSGGTNEFLGGVEWTPVKNLTVSTGFQITNYSNTDEFINDISYVVNSWSFGLGAKYQVSEKVAINAAYFQTNYGNYKQNTPDANGTINKFTRTNNVAAIGVDLSF